MRQDVVKEQNPSVESSVQRNVNVSNVSKEPVHENDNKPPSQPPVSQVLPKHISILT